MHVLLISAFLSGTVSIVSAVLADTFLSQHIPLAGSFAGLQFSQNPGVTFGVAFAPTLQMTLIAVALVAVAWMSLKAHKTAERVAYGLILGGGLANIIDRLRDGLVTDYFQIGSFPVFNVADSCITVGVGILFMEFLLKRKG
ncbi:signal peptidase II [Candidatus Peregrinibacteria bacterium CG1_02_54_53]|nr:MAG: signal peptidase II [Candidatus Peregrinibacteria bacterium CG1_02_54_53]